MPTKGIEDICGINDTTTTSSFNSAASDSIGLVNMSSSVTSITEKSDNSLFNVSPMSSTSNTSIGMTDENNNHQSSSNMSPGKSRDELKKLWLEEQEKNYEFVRSTFDVRHRLKFPFHNIEGMNVNDENKLESQAPSTSHGTRHARERGRGDRRRRYLNKYNQNGHYLEFIPESEFEIEYKTKELGRALFGDNGAPEISSCENQTQDALVPPKFGQAGRPPMDVNNIGFSGGFHDEVTNVLNRSTSLDGIFGRFPGDHPKNYNNPSFNQPIVFGPNDSLYKPRHVRFPMDDGAVGAMVTGQGIISIGLTGGTRVFLCANKGLRLYNGLTKTVIALSPNGTSSAMIHKSGKVYQYGSRVEICTNLKMHENIIAKMWYKGISFSTENGALTYLLDGAGARTSSDNFSDMHGDFTTPVFLDKAHIGDYWVPRCSKQLQMSQYWIDENGTTENWLINGIRITRTDDDVVRVIRGKSQIRICGNGSASISTPYIHCTASFGKTGPESSHLFVRRGERRLHCDGSLFICRNGGQSAGFDNNCEFRVF